MANLKASTITSISTTSHGTSANWKAAFDWGNHADAGYIKTYTDTNTVTSVGISGDLSTGNIELRGAGATTVTKSGGTITITSSDTNTTYSAGTGLTLSGTVFSVTAGTYAAASHTHSYLPLSGGTLTGDLEVGGNITATGEITAYSDQRLKESITTIDNAVALVKQLRGVRYVMKETQKQSVGVIAQEIIEALPEVVSESQEGMLSVAYGNIVSVLIEAIKEQQVQIDELKKVIEEKCQ